MRTVPPIGPKDVEALARTIDGEADDQPDAARIGVGNVILNRAVLGTFPGGKNVGNVCMAHRQFDCWDEDTADFKRIMKATTAQADYAACLGVALALVQFKVPDNTGGAVFYHDTSREGPPAVWGAVRFTVQHGDLKFYAQVKK